MSKEYLLTTFGIWLADSSARLSHEPQGGVGRRETALSSKSEP